MRALGHERFMVAGHDRGGRVAYRLALDHADAVSALIPIDIFPTAEVWRRTTAESMLKSYHWAFLAQPSPMPETLIAKDPVFYLEHTLKSWAKPRDLSPFAPAALEHYRALLTDPARIHAVCEDYRAGATIDRQRDEADLAAGRRIACPTFVLWARSYLPGDPLDVWRTWCTNVTGASVELGPLPRRGKPAGHAGRARAVPRVHEGGNMSVASAPEPRHVPSPLWGGARGGGDDSRTIVRDSPHP